MKCRDVLNYLLDLDNEEPIADDVEHHLAGCASCRQEAGRLRMATEVVRVRQTENGPRDDAKAATEAEARTERIMVAIRVEAPPAPVPVPFRNWLAAAAVILGGILGLQYSAPLDYLRDAFGPALDLALALSLGLFLTVYLCLLVGSNLPRVRRLFGVR